MTRKPFYHPIVAFQYPPQARPLTVTITVSVILAKPETHHPPRHSREGGNLLPLQPNDTLKPQNEGNTQKDAGFGD